MLKHIFRLLLFFQTALFIISCANPNSDFVKVQDQNKQSSDLKYQTKTILIYQKPFCIEHFYYLINLASLNQLDMNNFIPVSLEQSNIQTLHLDIQKYSSVNFISLSVLPSQIPQWNSIKNKVGNFTLLFPKHKPSFNYKNISILPLNNSYHTTYPDIIKKMSDIQFLTYILKSITHYDRINNYEAITQKTLYIQGKTTPNTNIILNSNTESKSTYNGLFSLITEEKEKKLVFDEHGKKFQYFLLSMEHSFPFFHFLPTSSYKWSVTSFFKPISLKDFSPAIEMIMDEDQPFYTIEMAEDSTNQQCTHSLQSYTLSIKCSKSSLEDFKYKGIKLSENTAVYDFENK